MIWWGIIIKCQLVDVSWQPCKWEFCAFFDLDPLVFGSYASLLYAVHFLIGYADTITFLGPCCIMKFALPDVPADMQAAKKKMVKMNASFVKSFWQLHKRNEMFNAWISDKKSRTTDMSKCIDSVSSRSEIVSWSIIFWSMHTDMVRSK